ncbi:MAG: hypothetical protein EBT79_02415 [Actinobacteria bacterium]|nr:hypothetical protein [Actinomycetota bacterium]NBR66129.1 hypothetical protein [Actinomycetota bacterium]
MSSLRNRIIRLAAANPALRAELLPLLKEDADPTSVDQNKPEHYYGLPPKGVQASDRSAAVVPSLDDLEAALRKARREVFDDNQVVADAASLEIKRLRKLIEAHPDEVARRDRVEHDRSERMLRRWL